MHREMKDSGVEWIGEIPKDRKIIRNKYYLNYIKGKNPNNINNQKLGIPYIGATDLSKNGLDNNYDNYTTDDSIQTCNKEDILILWDGARAGLIGRNHIGAISSTIMKINTNDNFVCKQFLYWYLRGLEKYLYECVDGTTIPHMYRKYIEDIMFIDWNKNQQIKIAYYLDQKVSQIDSIIEKTKLTIEEYKKYKQSIITEAVTKGLNPNVEMKDSGIEWVGNIPKHWEVRRIKTLFFEVNNKNLDDKNAILLSLFTSIGVKPRNEMEEKGNKASTVIDYKIVKENDIIVNKLLAWMGAIGYSDYEGVTSPDYDIYRAIPGANVVRNYYNNYFRYTKFKDDCYKYGRGIMMMRWRTYPDHFKSIYILNPPNNEQIKISSFIEEKNIVIDKLILKKQNLITELESYKKSLIYEYVTGKKEVM